MQATSEGLLRRGQIPQRTRKLPVKVDLRRAQCRYKTWSSDLARVANALTAGSASSTLISRGPTITAPDQECHATTRRVHSGSISVRSEPEPAWYVLSVVSPSRLSKPGRNGCSSFSVPSAGVGGQRVRPEPSRIDINGRKFAELLVAGKISPQTYEEWNRETARRARSCRNV
jgi:hypothetical protein